LAEYRAKRDFRVTPEPAPRRVPKRRRAPTFMVHKHDASRLHYDVRLEMDDALASWSVPKGPSYDPSTKRLAVQTEDHPLEYGQFEGRIPDGEYGAGDSLIWDRGTYDTVPPGQASEQRKKGHLNIELQGEKLKGRWHLVRTKQGWLLFKAKDALANPRFDVIAERPESVVSGRRVTRGPERAKILRAVHPDPEKLLERLSPPMLATLVDAPPPDEANWVSEVKYDGFRALCALSGGKVAMWSRNGLDLSDRFPAIYKALSKIVVAEAVIDGEAVALDEDGVARFQRLQGGDASVLYAFDLLWLDGRDLRGRPLEERRDLLASVMSNLPSVLRLAERMPGTPSQSLEHAKKHGWEGVVCKRRGSIYEARRSKAWIKLKAMNAQELTIIGFTPSKGNAAQIGALLLAVHDKRGYVYAGKVGTGFSSKLRTDLMKQLKKDAIDAPAAAGAPRMRDATWVEPRLVAQVQFTEWTGDGKLRHPSFQGLRDDKKPDEVVREKATHVKGAPSLVELTNPDRVIYPKDGITKQGVADYYAAVSGPLVRALADRPLALQHWPKGIAHDSWFHQNIDKNAPDWLTVGETPGVKRKVRHLIVDRPETLRWLAQRSALTIHMWSSRMEHLGMPDWVVFDLDPADGHGIEQTIEVAHALKRLLDELSLPSLPKTSGKRGLHVFVPLLPGHTHEDALGFAEHIGHAITSVLEQTTMERAKKDRHGRLYFDCYQNGYGKTMVAPYSLRGSDGAPVSAPLRWSEVSDKLDPLAYNLRTMPERLRKVGDLWNDAISHGARLPRFK
jgi:bifunctional non-homologous end joining protein LigD